MLELNFWQNAFRIFDGDILWEKPREEREN
jgi:hypothetical protein